MDNANYDLKNKGLHLVKTDKENFWTLMGLRVAKDQKNFVAANAVSLAQASLHRLLIRLNPLPNCSIDLLR